MTDNNAPSLTHNGISYALYNDKKCGGCGADNWRGEKLALAYLPDVNGYMCPPCVNTYLAGKAKS